MTLMIVDYVERFLSYIFYNHRAHDNGLFTRQEQFKGIKSTISVTSTIPEEMPVEYTAPGGDHFPPLSVSRDQFAFVHD